MDKAPPAVNYECAEGVQVKEHHTGERKMKELVLGSWDALMNNNRNPLRHLDLASQHFFMQALAWMWSMVFSLTFFSIFQFGVTWLAHMAVIAGICITVAVFREAEKQAREKLEPLPALSAASRCVWKLDSEA